MAERRMFAKTIIDSDAFLEMPHTTQNLYFHLAMRADDDGFINNPRSLMRAIGCRDDDIKLLIAKKFIIPFESGVVVIKHWKIHNYIQSDRYNETKYKDEKSMLQLDKNKAYQLLDSGESQPCIQSGSTSDTQVRLGKDRLELGKDSIDIPQAAPAKSQKHKYGEYQNVLLTDDQLQKLKDAFADWEARIENLSKGIELKGYKYKNHYLAILKWAEKDSPRKPTNITKPGYSSFNLDEIKGLIGGG